MDVLVGIVGSLFSGGATGLLGVLLSKVSEHFKGKQDLERLQLEHANALALQASEQAHKLQVAQLDADSKKALAQIDQIIQLDRTASADAIAALKHDEGLSNMLGKAKGEHWVIRAGAALIDGVRASIRPAATIYVNVLLGILFVWVLTMWQQAGLQLNPAEVKDLGMQVVNTVLGMASGLTFWWFGIRKTK
jgi:hypothetical protein